ncbi:MAG: HAMP domain-containing histidine kinase [Bacteroidales bacterium]|nr:HAMP domain-containing histidine kinase [Bacteroidales bacterium]
MKKNIILIAGVASTLILISVQAFIIGQIWNQKNELFRIKYRQLSTEALEFFENENRTNGFDTALYVVDYYASLVLRSDEFIEARNQETDSIKALVLSDVTEILTERQYLAGLLSKYFKKHGYDGSLTTSIVINYLELLDLDNVTTIHVDDDYLNNRTEDTRILVSRFKNEDNHHRISFDFYIDVAGKRAIILREMLISFFMSGLSIIVVITIFILAYRNLLEERRLSELKTDFINNMTHELKTPLSTITVASKTLEMDQVIAERERIIETARLIGKQSVNLNQLINLILEISIWERTEFEPEMKQVAVGPVLSDIIRSFSAGHRDSALITERINLEGLSIKADVTYFTTMINNLLSNAVKYSPINPEVDIEAYSDGSEITISIRDNGIGISKSDQKHIFDKFYRVSHGDIHKTKGLGLGLYYVNRICAAHGGRIELTSQPGKGSIFTVILPLQ